MVKNPSVVLADEPTGALDHGNSDMVIETLATFAAAGNTVLIATHSDQVTAACDRRIDLSMPEPLTLGLAFTDTLRMLSLVAALPVLGFALLLATTRIDALKGR